VVLDTQDSASEIVPEHGISTVSGVRVLLGLRRDYFLDVYTLADALPALVPQRNLFTLEYFTAGRGR
jgi:hypothetical protein